MRGGWAIGQPRDRGPVAGAIAGFGLGLLSSAFSMTAITGSLGGAILASLAPLPLFAAGLGWGVTSVIVAGAATLAAMGGAFGWIVALASTVTVVLPVWSLTFAALSRRVVRAPSVGDQGGKPARAIHALGVWAGSDGLALSLALTGTMMVVALTVGALGNGGSPRGEILGLLRRSMGGFVTGGLSAGGETVAGVEEALGVLAGFPGLIVAWLLTVLAVNAALAQGVLARFGVAIRPNPRMALLGLPAWFAWMTAAVGLITLAASQSGAPEVVGFGLRNFLIILGFAYFLAGLGVVHAYCLRYKNRALVLFGFYILLFLVSMAGRGLPVLALAVLGLVDGWADFRGLYKPADQTPGR